MLDPRASGLISVLRVDLSPEMANAMVFVSIYPEERSELTMHALRHAARHIRHQAAELIDIRKMPIIEFRLDRTLKHQAEVFGALAKAREQTPPTDLTAEPGEEADEGGTPPGAADAANDPSAPPQGKKAPGTRHQKEH